jgi:hypothetical protein
MDHLHHRLQTDWENDGHLIDGMPRQRLGADRTYPGPYDDGGYPEEHGDWMRVPPSAHGG